MKIPRVRFAPSPTGQLHLGGARTALSNYLYAKNQGGKFLIRIEDTDLERSKKEYIDQICDSLKWLGLKWDDEIVYQSDNKLLYNHWIEKILETKKAYRCFASKDELDSYRNKKGSLHYPGIWRDRSTSDVNKQLEKGTPFTIRIKTLIFQPIVLFMSRRSVIIFPAIMDILNVISIRMDMSSVSRYSNFFNSLII